MNYEPLVSIVIPVYNGSNFLKEAIDSALNQTYKNIEVIVVNDGSNDDGKTEEIALSYGDRITYYSKENGGVSTALNLGISKMKGEYFSWLSHDDMYKPDKIEKSVEILSKYDSHDLLVLCASEQINKDSECIKKAKPNSKLKIGFNEYHKVLDALFAKGAFNGCAFLIPRKAFDLCGFFDEQLRYSQDSLMWAKIFFNKFPLVYTDYVGVMSRVHDGQLTQKGRMIFYKDSLYASKIVIPYIGREKENAKKLMYSYTKYFAKMNCVDAYKECLKVGKMTSLLSLYKRLKLKAVKIYGSIRPLIRRVYFRLVKRVKTD